MDLFCTREYGFARKATYAYEIEFAHKATYYIHMNTVLRVRRLIAYIYDLCAQSNFCVQVPLCTQSDLLLTYEYGFARKAYQSFGLKLSDLEE